MIQVKLGRPLVNPLLRIMALVVDCVNSSIVRVIISYLAVCSRIARKSGIRFLVIWLKAQYVNLQQAVGGQASRDMTPLGARVARGGSKLPRVIPILHRVRIRAGDHQIIRLWMSLFSLYRVLEAPWTLKLDTITDPGVPFEELQKAAEQFAPSFWVIAQSQSKTKWLGMALKMPGMALLQLVAKPFLIPKSSPTVRNYVSTSPQGVMSGAIALWNSKFNLLFQEMAKITSSVSLLQFYYRTLKTARLDPLLDSRVNPEKTLEQWRNSPLRGTVPDLSWGIGKLGFKEEAAGKLRVFAIVDCWTQWLLYPLHSKLFEILRGLDQDGTFDQEAPLGRFKDWRGKPLYSFDLSAATDRLPVSLQKVVLGTLLGQEFAQKWAELLIGREYSWNIGDDSPWRSKYGTSGVVRYAVGQPMGALTSWAMLAICHHFIIQMAASRARVVADNLWFRDYAVLGDDVVIGNELVAKEYLFLIRSFGVSISAPKSLISPQGKGLEFAKRFIVGGVNLSPIPFLEYFASTLSLAAALQVAGKYQLTVGRYLHLLGFGYRSKAQINKKFSQCPKRLRNALLAWWSPSGPMGLRNLVPYVTILSTSSQLELVSRPEAVVNFIQSLKDQLLNQLKDIHPLVLKARSIGAGGEVSQSLADYVGIKAFTMQPANPVLDALHTKAVVPFVTSHAGPFDEYIHKWVADWQTQVIKQDLFKAAMDFQDVEYRIETLEPTQTSLEKLESCLEELVLLERTLSELAVPRSDFSNRPPEKAFSLVLNQLDGSGSGRRFNVLTIGLLELRPAMVKLDDTLECSEGFLATISSYLHRPKRLSSDGGKTLSDRERKHFRNASERRTISKRKELPLLPG